MIFFFKNEKADKKQKKCKTLSSQNRIIALPQRINERL